MSTSQLGWAASVFFLDVPRDVHMTHSKVSAVLAAQVAAAAARSACFCAANAMLRHCCTTADKPLSVIVTGGLQEPQQMPDKPSSTCRHSGYVNVKGCMRAQMTV